MTPNSPNPTKLLAPFDDETQDYLRFVDKACNMACRELSKKFNPDGETLLDDNELAMLELSRAFGILFNRGVDAGWITGVHVEKESEIIV